MLYKIHNFGLLLLLLISIASCNTKKFQTNSECILPDLPVAIGQSVDHLDINSPVFTDIVDDFSEGYMKFNHLDSTFESDVLILYTWGSYLQSISISRELIKTGNMDKVNIEESLNDVKHLWLNCNIPIDTINIQLANIKRSLEKDSFGAGRFCAKTNLGMREVYSWGYRKLSENDGSRSKNESNSLYLHYHAEGYRK